MITTTTNTTNDPIVIMEFYSAAQIHSFHKDEPVQMMKTNIRSTGTALVDVITSQVKATIYQYGWSYQTICSGGDWRLCAFVVMAD